MTARVAGAGLVCALLLGLGAGCGNGGGGGESRPTLSPSVSPTLPAPTRTPTRTGQPTETPTEQPTEQPTETPTEQPTERPTRTPTERPTQKPTEQPTQQPTSTPTQSPTEQATEEATAESTDSESASAGEEPTASDSADEGTPSWVWWLLAALVVAGGALTWFLLARSRRQRAWQEQLQAAEAEVAWLARGLLPQLRGTGSAEQAAGGWQVALPRVAAAEDQLTVLESSAKDAAAGARAGELRNAVRDARSKVEVATSAGGRDTWVTGLDDAVARLESALAPQPGGKP